MTKLDLLDRTPKKKKRLGSMSLLEIICYTASGIYYIFSVAVQILVIAACWKYLFGG